MMLRRHRKGGRAGEGGSITQVQKAFFTCVAVVSFPFKTFKSVRVAAFEWEAALSERKKIFL